MNSDSNTAIFFDFSIFFWCVREPKSATLGDTSVTSLLVLGAIGDYARSILKKPTNGRNWKEEIAGK